MNLIKLFQKNKKRNDTSNCTSINENSNVQQQSKRIFPGIKPIDLDAPAPADISEEYRQFPFPTRRDDITTEYDVSAELLGAGMNGAVLACWHRATNRKCALKIIKDSNRARREVILHRKACEGCDHIVQILDIYENMFESKRCLYIVMECMEGGELYNRLRHRIDKPYTEREAANIVLMMAKAVAHLHHMDIAHRDLKPENLLFTNTSEDALLKLTDFGFAKEGNNEKFPLITPCYSLYYAPPEILSYNKYNKACDIWSMGVITYIILCGYPPFHTARSGMIGTHKMKSKIKAGNYEFPKAEWNKISPEAKSLVQKMLIVDPSARVTIDWILQCPWLVGPVPKTPIGISPMLDFKNYEQTQIEIAAANDAQRRLVDDDDGADEDDSNINLPTYNNSRLAKRVAQREQKRAIANGTPPLSQTDERETIAFF
ncbi:unnamed protein product [Rotaria sp. Silwood1]|nr:unnamed protein product [Rotaria sp. Silwood1]CAF4803283.1 unnamed protein product [Rotaria sp. Silwood1]